MEHWTNVCSASELLPGGVKVAELGDGRPVAVFRVGNDYYAIEDRCSHEDENLSWGTVQGCEVTCPRHGARFSLRTGEALSLPAYEPVAVFSVRVREGMVQIAAAPAGPGAR